MKESKENIEELEFIAFNTPTTNGTLAVRACVCVCAMLYTPIINAIYSGQVALGVSVSVSVYKYLYMMLS